jgi:hypothetical protein
MGKQLHKIDQSKIELLECLRLRQVNNLSVINEIVVGNMSGLFVGAFLSHFLGFIGPFAFVGNHSNIKY